METKGHVRTKVNNPIKIYLRFIHYYNIFTYLNLVDVTVLRSFASSCEKWRVHALVASVPHGQAVQVLPPIFPLEVVDLLLAPGDEERVLVERVRVVPSHQHPVGLLDEQPVLQISGVLLAAVGPKRSQLILARRPFHAVLDRTGDVLLVFVQVQLLEGVRIDQTLPGILSLNNVRQKLCQDCDRNNFFKFLFICVGSNLDSCEAQQQYPLANHFVRRQGSKT